MLKIENVISTRQTFPSRLSHRAPLHTFGEITLSSRSLPLFLRFYDVYWNFSSV